MANNILNNEHDDITIRYQFVTPQGKPLYYKVELDVKEVKRINVTPNPRHSEWTQLEYKKCDHCTLTAKDSETCPAAVSLSELVDDWAHVKPYDEVYVECRANDKRTSANVTVQQGLSALMGLLMASSGCPHLHFFKPMARFHLPLASPEETSFRAIGTFLIAQYLSGQSERIDIEKGLSTIYYNLEIVNRGMAERLRSISEQDATISGVVVLDLLSKIMSYSIDETLDQIKHYFGPYLNSIKGHSA